MSIYFLFLNIYTDIDFIAISFDEFGLSYIIYINGQWY